MTDQSVRSVRVMNGNAPEPRLAADGETVQSVDRALAIVELLLRGSEPLTVREVALGTGINRTTAHRLLASLHRRGWIERVPGSTGLRPSLRYLALVRTALAGRDFVEELLPTMEQLARHAGETVHLGVLDGEDALHIAKVDSPQVVGVSSRVGTRVAAHRTGLGKALLAMGPESERERYLIRAQSLPPPYTLTDPDALREELALVRTRGYAVDDGEASPGVRCLAVAIRGIDGQPLFAVSLTGPSARFTMEDVARCVPEMLGLAERLSGQFGGGGASDAVA